MNDLIEVSQEMVNQNHPMVKAWQEYKSSTAFRNSRHWAAYAEHVDGSLWSVFVEGWNASEQVNPELQKMRGEISRMKDALSYIAAHGMGSTNDGKSLLGAHAFKALYPAIDDAFCMCGHRDSQHDGEDVCQVYGCMCCCFTEDHSSRPVATERRTSLLAIVVDEINQFAMAHSKVEAAGADATAELRAAEWSAYMNLLQIRDAAEQAVEAELLSSQNQSGNADGPQPA